MKRFIFPALVLIVLCTAWVFYLQWDNKRFVENLPNAQPPTNIEASSETNPHGSLSENEASVFEEIRPDTRYRPPVGSHSDSHAPGSGFQIQRHIKRIVKDPEKDPLEAEEDQEEEQESGAPLTFMDLSFEEWMESKRQFFIRQHGDIPEIDIYLKLNEPFYRALKNGETVISIKRTPEESLESSRVTAILFPTEENKKAYQEELKMMKELGVIK
ncbi:hypothetical protein C6499_13755 [Candidatus Poribacteria bacterium]|nr:MAG: hypothetical protein C6499_13755 [Candidatus Poribacteria bacterium]